MKNIIKIASRILLVLAICLPILTQVAFAQTETPEGIVDSIVSAPIKIEGEDKEYAHVWFSQIFGDFIFAPWDEQYADGNVTLVSKTVGFTNILALILGAVVVFYVLIGGALNTANHGEALGKEWSSLWLPIRTSLGFFLITPITALGGGAISFAQMLIIWLIMLGSNAASVLWNGVLDEISSGANVNAPQISVGLKPTMDIASMLMCTEYYLRNKSGNSVFDEPMNKTIAEIITDSGRVVVFPVTFDSNTDSYRIKGVDLGGQIASLKPSKISFAKFGACGTIDFKKLDGVEDLAIEHYEGDYKTIAMSKGYDKAIQLTANVVSALVPAISDLTEYGKGPEAINEALASPEDSPLKAVFANSAAAIGNAGITYSTTLIPEIHDAIINDSSIQDQFKNNMKKGGWGKAGVWFYEIAAIPGLTYKVYNNVMSGIIVKEPNLCSTWGSLFGSENCKQTKSEYEASKQLLANVAEKVIADGKSRTDDAISELDEALLSNSEGTASSYSDVLSRSGTKYAKIILNLLANGVTNDPVGNTTGLNSPFETVSSIGHSMNQLATYLWVAGLAMSTAAGAIELGSPEGIVGGVGGALMGAIKWILGTAGLAIGAAIGSGFVLAYVIPFMPIITWTMMIVGYLITVVEAVIAAPLAIILMVTPEGEGIAGTRLERAMQLLAMAILKPSLMIMGLVTAITVSAVGFSILNEFFFLTAEYQLTGMFIDFIPVILIYVSASLNLCKMLVGLMHNLPTQILDWFSSGTGRSFGEQESTEAAMSSMGELKGAAGGMGKMFGSSLSSSARTARSKSGTKAAQQRHREMMEQLSKK